ncbi:MAG: glycoside hydrolase family 2 [Clostridia bacterium]|nr:glycoside hydrolase family 2 [Clostridia bacterium]
MKLKRAPRTCQLHTPFEADKAAWQIAHPRPQAKREAWQSLCGPWKLSVRGKTGEQPLGEIYVPFPPESHCSGIERTLKANEAWVYRKCFSLHESMCGKTVLLHFGAVDQICTVAVNGNEVGEHVGGYLPFTLDITPYLQAGENEIVVTVRDPLSHDLGYGKQRKARGGMWYTPISGIWQPVWLEGVPKEYVRELRLTPTRSSVTIETVGGATEKTILLHTEQGDIVHHYTGDRTELVVPNPKLWTPETPHLYAFTLLAGEDRVESYFALRTMTVENVCGQSYLCLNGKPYFFHGLLDQGYFSDGIYLPASPEGYRFDIAEMKRLGFNMLRKHIKIEPDLFYYECDRLGMTVFQDLVNSGDYSFLYDTALPTVGFKRLPQHRASGARRAQFLVEADATVAALYNHPSVVYYTIFNEGWGQFDADGIYTRMKAKDPTRVWDATSGWFQKRESDVTSEHVYFKPIRLKPDPNRPLVLSEFGGYSCKIDGHAFNLDKTYGYRKLADPAALQQALTELYQNEVIPAVQNGLSAAVLTQVSDVEDETNGLVTYDRQVVKVEEAPMRALAEALFAAFSVKTKR